jgi:hypothetical protein
MKPGNDLGRAGLSLFAGCVSYCVSNVCDVTRELFEPERLALTG